MREDESEGADILLVCFLISIQYIISSYIFVYYFLSQTLKKMDFQVKPGLPYLDIIRLLRDNSPLPIAAYQVFLWLILEPSLKISY